MNAQFAPFLEPTGFLDFEHRALQRCTAAAIGKATDPVEQARRVLTAVRDLTWYDAYIVSEDPRKYRASTVAIASRAHCIPKAVLLTASCRAPGIPARLGFAGVRNHLQCASLRQRTDVVVCQATAACCSHIINALRASYGQLITDPTQQQTNSPSKRADERFTHAKHHARRPAHRENDRETCGIDSR